MASEQAFRVLRLVSRYPGLGLTTRRSQVHILPPLRERSPLRCKGLRRFRDHPEGVGLSDGSNAGQTAAGAFPGEEPDSCNRCPPPIGVS